MLLLATPTFQCAETTDIMNRINELLQVADANPREVIKAKLNRLDGQSLKRVSDSLKNSNFEFKTDVLAKLIFAAGFATINNKKNAMTKSGEALVVATRKAFTLNYLRDNGSYDWKCYEDDVHKAIVEVASAAGAARVAPAEPAGGLLSRVFG